MIKHRKDHATGNRHQWTIRGIEVPREKLNDVFVAILDKYKASQQIVAGLTYENAKLEAELAAYKDTEQYLQQRLKQLIKA